jgi:hypothetical protein
VEGSGRGLIVRYYPGNRLEGLWKTDENIQDSLSPGRDLNPVPPEYEAGVLTTQARRSVENFSSFEYWPTIRRRTDNRPQKYYALTCALCAKNTQ